MRSIIETVKNKQIIAVSISMFLIHLFISISLIYVLVTDDSVYVVGTSDRTQGYIAITVGTILAFVISTIVYILAISRIRGIFAIILIILPIIAAILIQIFVPQTNIVVASNPIFGPILVLTFYLGYLIFGASNWIYFKLKNLYFTLLVLAFWHFGTVAIYIADKLRGSEITYENVLSKIATAWDLNTIILITFFMILAGALMVFDSKIILSTWSKDLRKESKLGWKNLSLLGGLFTLALVLTLIIAPAFWRLHWQETERLEKERQEQEEKEREEQESETQDEIRKTPPQQYGDEYDRPQNDGDRFDSGGRIEGSLPLGEGNPIFVVKLGQEKATSAETKVTFASNQSDDEVKVEDKRSFVWRSNIFDKYSNLSGFTKDTTYQTNEYYSINKQQGYYYSGFENKYLSNEILEQRYVILGTRSFEVFTVNRPIEISYEGDLNVPYFFAFKNDTIITDNYQPLETNSRYFSRSEVFTGSEDELRKASARIGFTDNEAFPKYQFTYNSQIQLLARNITKDSSSDYDKVKAVEKYLRDNYEYKPNDAPISSALRESDINTFLFTTKTGELSHFSFAMVMLLNTLNFDSRISTGFYQGEYDPTVEGYVVRDNDFANWVEVFFNGYGWIEFHPAGSTEEIEEKRDEEGSTDKPLTPDQEQQIEDGLEDLRELEDLYDQRDDWQNGDNTPSDTPPVTPTPSVPTPTPTPTPSPTPEPKPNDTLKNMLEALWNAFTKIWWLICGGLLILAIILPIAAKNIKYAWRRGVFKKRTEKEQIKQYFALLQDTLIDFGDQVKLPETAYQFAERFVKQFPIEKKDAALQDELYTLATIYNRAVYADLIKPDDQETMNRLVDVISHKYLQSKGAKAILRWYNPAGLLRT